MAALRRNGGYFSRTVDTIPHFLLDTVFGGVRCPRRAVLYCKDWENRNPIKSPGLTVVSH